MPQSHSRILLHIVFSTKNYVCLISPEVENSLHGYIFGIMKNLNCYVLAINGMEEHIHILCDFPRTITVADLINKIKTGSTKWMKEKGGVFQKFHWQVGYGVFSVSQSKLKDTQAYIQNQKEHHKTMSYKEEYLKIVKKYGIPFDEKYMWD